MPVWPCTRDSRRRASETRSRAAMLEEVRITGLGVIDEAVLELSPGFNVVTGETGAGKTMVVSGLGLLFGGRADPRRIRPGAERATVEGRLRTDPDGEVARQVNNAGGDLDDDATLVLTRSVSAEGRSRAFAGGRSVPVSLLTYLADDLVAVHGQADQQQLLKPGRQREALDRFAGPELGRVLGDYQRAHQQHLKVAEELAELTSLARERAAEAEDLRRGLAEIERLEPAVGEDIELHAEAERLSEASYLVSDIAAELASYADSVEADPARLAAVQDRRAELTRLIRTYGSAPVPRADAADDDASSSLNGTSGTDAAGRVLTREEPAGTGDGETATSAAPEGGADGSAGSGQGGAPPAPAVPDLSAVLAWAKGAAARLAELDRDDDRIAGLQAREADLAGTVRELGGGLTTTRQEAAARFDAAVTAELTALAMPHARLSVVVSPLREYGPHGGDDVELRLAAHPGAPALPLHKGASGGELSRVMLAIEVVFAGADPVPTFVFDEVDAGVGGKAAVEVGRRLARLARLAQVIVVTHLPQVAAFADNHLMVEKADDGLVTSSGVTRLGQPGRIRELSRMLAGLEDSELGRAHAEELLEIAAAGKAAGTVEGKAVGR